MFKKETLFLECVNELIAEYENGKRDLKSYGLCEELRLRMSRREKEDTSYSYPHGFMAGYLGVSKYLKGLGHWGEFNETRYKTLLEISKLSKLRIWFIRNLPYKG